MAGEITYMTGMQLHTAIQAANQAVAGMTYAEAAAALGGSAQATTGGLTEIIQFPMAQVTGGQTVSLEAQYAAQTWEYWQTVAAATGTTAAGAAAAAAISWAQGALIGTGEGLAATAGLLTISVPTAVAMAAPLMGVALGGALYESNPTLWNNIAEGLVDFTIQGTQTIAALIDEAGHVLLDSAFVQKLKQLFQDNDVPLSWEIPDPNEYGPPAGSGIIATVGTVTGFSYSVPNSWAQRYTISDGVAVILGRRTAVVLPNELGSTTIHGVRYQQDPSTGRWISSAYTWTNLTSFIYNGQTVRYWSVTNPSTFGEFNEGVTYNVTDRHGYTDSQVAAICYYFGSAIQPSVDYPVGTSGWTNSSWNPTESTQLPTVPVYNPGTGNTQPYVPTTPYIGDTPGTTTDPEETPQPNPTSPITLPEWPTIEPWIPPIIDPEIQFPEDIPVPPEEELENPGKDDDPIYLPPPDLNPEIDPSQLPVPESVPQPEGPPPSSGLSPDIIFPPPLIPFPSIVPPGSDTPVSSGSPGFIQVYNPTPTEFINFGRWLWVTYAEATLETIWNNPFDGVIGAHELYATPSKDGYSTIRSGFLDSGISSIIVRQRYTQINCGSIVIPEYWGNYLDYSPYSQAYVYLPFIGIMSLDVDDIVGHAVNILYHVDSYTGSCIAQITVARTGYTNTVYQFSGDCAVEIPMAGGSQANIKGAMIAANAYQNAANISAGVSLIGGIASGILSGVGGTLGGNPAIGITSGVSQAIGGISSAISQHAYGEAQHTAAMVSQKSVVQHSGSFGSSHGAMGIKKPYIFIRRPIQKVVNNYNKIYGYPAHKMVTIGTCTGYLRCREVHVVSSLATDAEKSEIEQLLKTGVYVTE